MTGSAVRLCAVLGLVALSGCGFQKLQQGEPNFNTAILLPGYNAANESSIEVRNASRLLLTPHDLPRSCGGPGLPASDGKGGLVSQAPPAPDSPEINVTDCVYEIKSLIDDHYREYRITLHHFVDDGNAVLDVGSLGLSTAGALIGASGVKTTMAGFNSLLTGSKSIVNEDVLLRMAIESIINQMDADRQEQFGVMLGEMKGKSYSIAQAKNDLLIYFSDGTWDHALVSLQVRAAANSANCRTETDKAKVQSAQDKTTSPTNTSTGCQTTGSPTTTLTVGLLHDALTPSVKAAGGEITVPVTGMTDDTVAITLSPATLKIKSVTVNGTAQNPPSNKVTLNSTNAKDGKATIVFTLDAISATSVQVVATGTLGAQNSGPETLINVVVNK